MKIPHIETVERDGVTYMIEVDYPPKVYQYIMGMLNITVIDNINSDLKTVRYATRDFINKTDWVNHIIDTHITAHSKQSKQ